MEMNTKKFCLAKLCDETLMTKLVEELHENSSLEDFVKLINQLANGTMDAMNMSLLLCLDVVKLQSLPTKTAMRFRKETKQFWEVVYCICHGKGLHLFSGSKNQGCVQSASSVHGIYRPSSSNHNFAVPDKKSLRNSSEDLPPIILCGIIEESFQLLDKNKQYVISIDGKKIATGLGKDDIGDINLWGFEELSIELRKETKEKDLELVAVFEEAIDRCSFDENTDKLPEILSMLSGYIQDIRN